MPATLRLRTIVTKLIIVSDIIIIYCSIATVQHRVNIDYTSIAPMMIQLLYIVKWRQKNYKNIRLIITYSYMYNDSLKCLVISKSIRKKNPHLIHWNKFLNETQSIFF